MTPEQKHLLSEAVPRYTSYPTAPHFHAGIDAATFRGWLETLRCEAISLYVLLAQRGVAKVRRRGRGCHRGSAAPRRQRQRAADGAARRPVRRQSETASAGPDRCREVRQLSGEGRRETFGRSVKVYAGSCAFRRIAVRDVKMEYAGQAGTGAEN
jgi:hypothetical protein